MSVLLSSFSLTAAAVSSSIPPSFADVVRSFALAVGAGTAAFALDQGIDTLRRERIGMLTKSTEELRSSHFRWYLQIQRMLMNSTPEDDVGEFPHTAERMHWTEEHLRETELRQRELEYDLRRQQSALVEDGRRARASLARAYHQQVLLFSSVQYFVGLVIAVAALAFILFMFASSPGVAIPLVFLKALPGLVVGAVSGLFFSQANELRAEARRYYQELMSDDDVDRAITLVDSISDQTVRDQAKRDIALGLLGDRLSTRTTETRRISGRSTSNTAANPQNASDQNATAD